MFKQIDEQKWELDEKVLILNSNNHFIGTGKPGDLVKKDYYYAKVEKVSPNYTYAYVGSLLDMESDGVLDACVEIYQEPPINEPFDYDFVILEIIFAIYHALEKHERQ